MEQITIRTPRDRELVLMRRREYLVIDRIRSKRYRRDEIQIAHTTA